jgi:translation initiation factor IF-3
LPDNRINRQIRAKEVRVIGDDGELLGIMSVPEALEKAEAAGLDLVEVAPKADPPVCKVMDYGKFRYQQQKRAHEAKKKTIGYSGERSQDSSENR